MLVFLLVSAATYDGKNFKFKWLWYWKVTGQGHQQASRHLSSPSGKPALQPCPQAGPAAPPATPQRFRWRVRSQYQIKARRSNARRRASECECRVFRLIEIKKNGASRCTAGGSAADAGRDRIGRTLYLVARSILSFRAHGPRARVRRRRWRAGRRPRQEKSSSAAPGWGHAASVFARRKPHGSIAS
jgi:hypothetical protein